jgi:hypothetical protein
VRGLTVILALSLAGCAGLPYSPEFTVIAGPSRIESNNEPRLTMMWVQRFGKHGASACVHSSEPHHGEPVNDDAESTMDTCGLGARWGGKAQ